MTKIFLTDASCKIGKAMAYKFSKEGNGLIITARREHIL